MQYILPLSDYDQTMHKYINFYINTHKKIGKKSMKTYLETLRTVLYVFFEKSLHSKKNSW